ncbi:Flp pilus assembly protein CpaB [Litorimonas cladophorae]|uniref:Flp pilus assembly protein CpaB n=1 Tax=Litorimonas cladophorae TaxID=1220491 RepID=A0A918KIL2_9PROT|nr:Flp pilus assembly protein CpaB [Litorimonas cladophorae]GGX65217.1 Flp pilus assembly protein CpaB [Litorimonas cladophorae]
METKKIIILGAMVVMAGVVFVGINNLSAPAAAPVQAAATPEIQIQEVEYVPVLAIDADLSTGQRISEEMLTSIKWPAEALTANLINLNDMPDAKAEFVNSLARQPLAQGETLNRSKVIMAGDSGVMAALLAPGMRAVTTRISVDTAAGGFIQPGDRVDIIMRETYTVRRDNNAGQATQSRVERQNLFIAQTLFENVKVLAIDQTFTTGAESGAAIPGSTATFELSQSDAELLQEAEGYGDIYLTLRGANGSGYKGRSAARVDRDDVDTTPSTLTIYRNGQATPIALQQKN